MNGRRQQIDILLARRTLGDLSAAENARLERLLAAHPDIDRDAFERVAATVLLAAVNPDAVMPPGLRDRLHAGALSVLAGREPE